MCDVMSLPAILSIIGRHFKLCRYVNYYIAARISTPFCRSITHKQTSMHKQAIKHKQAIIGGGYLFTENACFNIIFYLKPTYILYHIGTWTKIHSSSLIDVMLPVSVDDCGARHPPLWNAGGWWPGPRAPAVGEPESGQQDDRARLPGAAGQGHPQDNQGRCHSQGHCWGVAGNQGNTYLSLNYFNMCMCLSYLVKWYVIIWVDNKLQ